MSRRTTFTQLNDGWNSDANAPNVALRSVQKDLEVTFVMNRDDEAQGS